MIKAKQMSPVNQMRRKLYEKILNEFFNGSDTKKLMDVDESKDSGYISTEIISEEIQTDDEFTKTSQASDLRNIYPEVEEEEDGGHMRFDSGIAFVAGQLSDLSLGSDGQKLNNLSGTTSSSKSKDSCSRLITENLPSTSLEQDDNKSKTKSVNELSPDSIWEYYFQQDDDGDTPLHVAIIHEFTEAIHSLIRLAPFPHLLDLRNDTCQSPLHLAVLTGQSFVVRLLILAGARKSIRDRNGETALHLACHKGDLLCVRALTAPVSVSDVERLDLKYDNIKYEAIDYEQWNYEGETCVHIAAKLGHTEILRHLVWLKADINAKEGKAGYTALHYAVARKCREMLDFLLTECQDLNTEITCYSRLTAYEITRDSEVRNLLVSKGAVAIETDSDENSSEDDGDSDSENKMSYSTAHYAKSTGVPINASA